MGYLKNNVMTMADEAKYFEHYWNLYVPTLLPKDSIMIYTTVYDAEYDIVYYDDNLLLEIKFDDRYGNTYHNPYMNFKSLLVNVKEFNEQIVRGKIKNK